MDLGDGLMEVVDGDLFKGNGDVGGGGNEHPRQSIALRWNPVP